MRKISHTYNAGYIGTMCPARHTVTLNPDGSVVAKFYGKHNHDVQSMYAVNFINPIKASAHLRNMVDQKLLAGVTNAGDIANTVRAAARANTNDRLLSDIDRLENMRVHQLSHGLTSKIVMNRRNVLGLRRCDGFHMDQDDAKSVFKLVEQWRQDPSFDSPVRYYKPVGVTNADTSEVIPKGRDKPYFSEKDFLLVLQTQEQAEMMKDNSRVIFVDGTHGLTGYGYHLLSVVVVDRHGAGLVVGEAISSRENHVTWELMAKHFRQPSLDSNPEVMMSDDTNSAWNGLSRVWASLKHKLLCHWHVMKNVREHCCGGKKTEQVRIIDKSLTSH